MKNKMTYLYVIGTILAMATALAFGQDPESVNNEHLPEIVVKILDYGTNIIGTASVIAAMTPTKKDNVAVEVLRKFLDFLAFNFGYVRAEKMKNGRREYDE